MTTMQDDIKHKKKISKANKHMRGGWSKSITTATRNYTLHVSADATTSDSTRPGVLVIAKSTMDPESGRVGCPGASVVEESFFFKRVNFTEKRQMNKKKNEL